MKATTEEQLLASTLAAACEITGAVAAAALRPDGCHRTHGWPDLAARLCRVDPAQWGQHNLWRHHGCNGNGAAAQATEPAPPTPRTGTRETGTRETGPTLDIGDAVCATLADITIVVASAPGASLLADARGLLPLVVAHAQAGYDRLRELDLLARRADSDPLTGLRHYRPFGKRLARSLPGRTAVVALDVDSFKEINDRYGHQAGDAALVGVAESLRAAVRDHDTLYRIGGDEFAVVVDVNGPAEAEVIARRLLAAARQVGRTVSIGVALHRDDETGQQTLLRADMAMYEAKRAGKNTVRLAD